MLSRFRKRSGLRNCSVPGGTRFRSAVIRGHLGVYRVEHVRIRDCHAETQDFLDSPSYRVNLWEHHHSRGGSNGALVFKQTAHLIALGDLRRDISDITARGLTQLIAQLERTRRSPQLSRRFLVPATAIVAFMTQIARGFPTPNGTAHD